MKCLEENTVDTAKEKHLPVVEKTADGFKVSVRSVAHPMEDRHYIEWIEFIVGSKRYMQFFNPGNPPETVFNVPAYQPSAREFCNLHGVWKG